MHYARLVSPLVFERDELIREDEDCFSRCENSRVRCRAAAGTPDGDGCFHFIGDGEPLATLPAFLRGEHLNQVLQVHLLVRRKMRIMRDPLINPGNPRAGNGCSRIFLRLRFLSQPKITTPRV